MSKSRYINKICAFAIIAALIITILFMSGKSFGLQTIVAEENESGEFTANDQNADWNTSSATVITLTGDGGTVKGNGAYIYDGDVYIVYAGKYVITGELNDGSVIVDADGDDKIWIQLNNANLTSSDGPALLVENAEKVFLTLAEGTVNTLTSGESFSEDAVENGYDGTIYSKDDLTINGNGSLSVTGHYAHGIVCNDDLVITGGTIQIEAADDAIHANDSVRIANANLTLTAGDDGITVSNDDGSDYFYIESGTLTITSCYEGIEANIVTISGGTITITPTDDGINATGTESSVDITGGTLTIINSDGRDADGIDSNGSIHISGGFVFVSVPSDGVSTAIDYGSENNGELLLDGGTVIASGSSGMLEGVSQDSTQGFVVYTGDGTDAETEFTLTDSDGIVLLNETIPIGFNALILTTQDMVNGESYTLTIGEEETTLTAGESSETFGGMGGFGDMGGMQPPSGDMPTPPDNISETSGDMPTPPTQGDSTFPDNVLSSSTDDTGATSIANTATMDDETADHENVVTESNNENFPTDFPFEKSDNNDTVEIDNSDSSNSDSAKSWKREFNFDDSKMPGGFDNQPSDSAETTEEVTVSTETWILLGCSILALIIGLIVAFRSKGR